MREVKRHAKTGETIKIVNAINAFGLYKNEDTFTVSSVSLKGNGHVMTGRGLSISPEEYVVLEPPTAAPVDDPVNSPAHYTAGDVECIDAIEAATTGLTGGRAYNTGAAIKYMWRWSRKGGAEDLRKARWYIDRLIADVEVPHDR